MKFLQSRNDFPMAVRLGDKLPSFGLHRYKQGLRFLPTDDEGFSLRGDKQRLVYKGRRRSHRFTILGDNAFEYDCILLREPESNVITLFLEGAENYDFFRQPDFVKDPFLKGSYAVYKKETLIGEGTGKLCHIKRPLIIDARGRKVWGNLSVIDNMLRITIPEWWLADAKYPVVVDPTIGTTTVGTLQEWPDYQFGDFVYFACDIAVNRFYVPETIKGICRAFAFVYDVEYDSYGLGAVYSDNANKPQNKLSTDEEQFDLEVPFMQVAWKSGEFQLKNSIPGGSYIWYGIVPSYWAVLYDYGSTCVFTQTNYYYNVFAPEQFPVTNYSLNMKLSMYFTYSNAQNYVRTLTQGVRLSDSRKLTANYNKALLQTARGNDKISRFETFFRNCFDSVKNNMSLLRLPVFMRITKENTGIASEIENKRELSRKCDETVSVNEEVKKNRGILRIIIENLTVTENASYPVLFICKIAETQGITDTIKQWGAYIRGLYDIADNLSANSRQGEFYRKENDNVQAVGSVFRGLLIFVRIFTTSFVRDFIIRRFLIAREELVLKSCITRELTIDSKIN